MEIKKESLELVLTPREKEFYEYLFEQHKEKDLDVTLTGHLHKNRQ